MARAIYVRLLAHSPVQAVPSVSSRACAPACAARKHISSMESSSSPSSAPPSSLASPERTERCPARGAACFGRARSCTPEPECERRALRPERGAPWVRVKRG